MFGLADCNNFYASCERVFRPELNGRPVVVLSNNDGCIIARSNEAKELGIPMGAPVFKIRDIIEKNNVVVFSSNYALYGDMSHRVMMCLQNFAPEVEVYSIDEAFLHFEGMQLIDLHEYAAKITHTVKRNTGIPLSIGIAHTKTLAKVANHLAKKSKVKSGAFIIADEQQRIEALKNFEIDKIWGVGRQYAKFLKNAGINTALDFTKCNRNWVKKNLTVMGLRMWEELNGMPCHEIEPVPENKKTICTSRSFGNMLENYQTVEEAVSTYAARCGAKLRKQKSTAGVMLVFLHTNRFREDLPQYCKNIVIELPVPTNSTIELVKYAKAGLKAIFKNGFKYKKAGIIVSELAPQTAVQTNLFYEVDHQKHNNLMLVLDKLNNTYGRDTVRLGAQGYSKRWTLRQEQLSPCYTTSFENIMTVKC
ncbi:MAG: Y-family DNA polymerase [Bacteroidetes bacterium]|nr:Y-family DNA polymerase [Bacteroidota bacterium]